MKKIVSTQGLLSGKFDAPSTNTSIHERVDNKLRCSYKHSFDDDIQPVPSFTYEVKEGQVTVIEFSYTIDNPTTERLEHLRFACECFYGLHGFKVDNDNNSPRVYFRATDIFDMASLIHAIESQSVSLESVMCAVDGELTDKDAIYSPSGAYIIQIPDVPHYRIEEGTLFVCPHATRHCKCLRSLDIPVGFCDLDKLSDFPFPLQVKVWDTHYDGTPAEDVEKDYELAMSDVVFDDYDVGYSKDNKTLKFCRYTFNETHYEVPDGVEVIESGAFIACRHFLELSIPKSVKTIDDFIFGNGGVIKIREK